MLYSTAAYESYKFEREIQIHGNDLSSLAASIQEKLLGEHFSKAYSVYLNRCLWLGAVSLLPIQVIDLHRVTILLPQKRLLIMAKLDRHRE